jgi:hypothetical protein
VDWVAASSNAVIPGHVVPGAGNQVEKKWTPAITFPQIRQGIAMILHEAFQGGTRAHMRWECQQRLQRNELARFYHWKQRNLLAPLNLYKRQF